MNAPCVGNYSCDADIANVFGSKLQGLYNADNSYDSLSDIDSSLSSSDLAAISVSSHMVCEALTHLN